MLILKQAQSNLSLAVCKILMTMGFPWRRRWHPTPVLLPGDSHGQRCLVGCSPWGRWESDMTEWLPFHLSLSCIGAGNGNPLRRSCLENPRDRAAWWAAIYGVPQSQTRLKWLSSSSSSSKPLLPWTWVIFPLITLVLLSFPPGVTVLFFALHTEAHPLPG